MSAARKTKSDGDQPSLRERARVARAATQRRSQTEPRLGLPTQPSTCAAARVGRAIANTSDAIEALDAIEHFEKSPCQKLEEHRLERLRDELRQAASYTRASSPAGVLSQLAVAYAAIDLIHAGSSDEIRSTAHGQADRCLMSIAAAICAWTGIDRDGHGAAALMPARIDTLAIIPSEVA